MPGYIRQQKIRRGLITLLMFAIPVGIFISAQMMTGTTKNIMTVVSVVGIIPAAKFAVDWIMILMNKSAPEEIVELTRQKAGNLACGFELVVTAYEGSMPLDAVVVCGNECVCFSTWGKKELIALMEKHIFKILCGNNYYSVNVKIFQEKRAYADRLTQIAANPDHYREGIRFTPDERYPDLSRDELILHTVMAISL